MLSQVENRREMIFFTMFVTLIRRQLEGTDRRLGSPARVEGNTLRLPIGTDVQRGDCVEHHPPNDEPRMMTVIDVHMSGAGTVDDYIEVTCVPNERMAIPEVTTPTLHPMMSAALALLADGHMSEAVVEALQLVEERVRSLMGNSLTGSNDPGHPLMESVFGVQPPPLDITTAQGPAAEDENEGFRLLFIGAMLGLRNPRLRDQHRTGRAIPAAVDETWEYLALASMLMRRLDRAERNLG